MHEYFERDVLPQKKRKRMLPLELCRSAGARTPGPLIKSQLLYQLSYRPESAQKYYFLGNQGKNELVFSI